MTKAKGSKDAIIVDIEYTQNWDAKCTLGVIIRKAAMCVLRRLRA